MDIDLTRLAMALRSAVCDALGHDVCDPDRELAPIDRAVDVIGMNAILADLTAQGLVVVRREDLALIVGGGSALDALQAMDRVRAALTVAPDEPQIEPPPEWARQPIPKKWQRLVPARQQPDEFWDDPSAAQDEP